jgi:hypothetical protein
MKEYKVVSVIFDNGLPDMHTIEEVIPLVVLSKEDVEEYLGKEISNEQFNKFKEQILNMNVPDEELNSWLLEEIRNEFAEKEK